MTNMVRTSIVLNLCDMIFTNERALVVQKANEFYFKVRSLKNIFGKYVFDEYSYPTNESIDDFFDSFYFDRNAWGWKSSHLMAQCYELYHHYIVPDRLNKINKSAQAAQAMCLAAIETYPDGPTFVHVDTEFWGTLIERLTTEQRELLLKNQLTVLLNSNVKP